MVVKHGVVGEKDRKERRGKKRSGIVKGDAGDSWFYEKGELDVRERLRTIICSGRSG